MAALLIVHPRRSKLFYESVGQERYEATKPLFLDGFMGSSGHPFMSCASVVRKGNIFVRQNAGAPVVAAGRHGQIESGSPTLGRHMIHGHLIFK